MAGFLRRWILLVTLGETLGFAVPALAATAAIAAGLDSRAFIVVIVAAGIVEGACLGFAQATALRGVLAINRRRWCAMSATGAGISWSLGMLPSTLQLQRWSLPAAVATVAVIGMLLLVALPSMQWLELRRRVRRAGRWIPLSMLAWMVGLAWTFAPSPLVDEDTGIRAIAGIYSLAGLLMAVTVATITGLGLTRWILVTDGFGDAAEAPMVEGGVAID